MVFSKTPAVTSKVEKVIKFYVTNAKKHFTDREWRTLY